MNCPFCFNKLSIWKSELYTTYGCVENGCTLDDMSRYQITYTNYPTILVGKTFMLDKYYIEIDYQNNTTAISRLKYCFKMDMITINKALTVNFKNIGALLIKINTLMLFS